MKAFSIVMVLAAVVLGILASILPTDRMADMLLLYKFFKVMIPVLAVGALVKYLFTSSSSSSN